MVEKMRRVTVLSVGLTVATMFAAAGCESSPEEESDEPEMAKESESSESSGEGAGNEQREQEMATEDGTSGENEGAEQQKRAAGDEELGQEALRGVTRANLRFGFDLYDRLRAENKDDNLFYSPLNLATVLAMVRGGAGGETGEQIDTVLHADDFDAGLHRAFSSVDTAIQPEKVDGEAPNRLETANAVWTQKGLQVKSEFESLMSSRYGTGLRDTDFRQDPEAARGTINDWVADRTKGMIPDLLPEGSIRERTRMVLTSAIYFSGAWASEFDPEATESDEFSTLSGETSEVEMMSQRVEGGWSYAEGDQWKAVELDYAGGAYRMTLLVPDEGAFRSVEKKLNRELYTTVVEQLESAAVDLELPKFEFSARFSARKHLADLGMTRAFENDAEFERITEDEQLFVDDVLHKARVSVDEKGTEAAAASGATMQATSLEPKEPDWKEVVVDRPFLFFIRHEPTGAVLFLGRAASV